MQMDASAPPVISRPQEPTRVLDALTDVLNPLTVQAREVLLEQARSIAQLSMRLDASFTSAIRLLFGIEGHVVIAGLGKSGHVGKKIAATLASTGTPSFFLHATEALHGDLGMVTERDAVVLISYSGETREVVELVPHLKARGVPTLALVGKMTSTLAREVDIALDVSVDREVCPNNLAPTSSTLVTLAMGDVLAVSLMKLRGFQQDDFARLHPGGSVGKRSTRVSSLAVTEGVSVLKPNAPLRDALIDLASSRYPMTLICEGDSLLGVLTADDVRGTNPDDLMRPVRDVMNTEPPVIASRAFVEAADRRLEQDGGPALVVVADNGEVLGLYPRRQA
ncbi:MAG: SIS domain-containing protein [Sandaracinaceae bacterium]